MKFVHLQTIVLVVCSFVLAGCSKSPENTTVASRDVSQKATKSVPPPAEIVVQLLDSMRTGDDSFGSLLTLDAQKELEAVGLEFSPPGSPLARYEIGETRFLDNDKDAAYVETTWIEPAAGQQSTLESGALLVPAPDEATSVVWAVRLENEGWRIAGMAVDRGPNLPPEVIDFENMPRESATETQRVAERTDAPIASGSGLTLPSNTESNSGVSNGSTENR